MYTLVVCHSNHSTRPYPGTAGVILYHTAMVWLTHARLGKHNHDLTYLSVINVLIISNEIYLHLTNIFN